MGVVGGGGVLADGIFPRHPDEVGMSHWRTPPRCRQWHPGVPGESLKAQQSEDPSPGTACHPLPIRSAWGEGVLVSLDIRVILTPSHWRTSRQWHPESPPTSAQRMERTDPSPAKRTLSPYEAHGEREEKGGGAARRSFEEG